MGLQITKSTKKKGFTKLLYNTTNAEMGLTEG